jgi:hypothetical protein
MKIVVSDDSELDGPMHPIFSDDYEPWSTGTDDLELLNQLSDIAAKFGAACRHSEEKRAIEIFGGAQ